MAVKKGSASQAGGWKVSWRGLFITGSLVLNTAFFVLFVAMAATPAFDNVYLSVGAERLCSTASDSRFTGSTPQALAYRDYMCARGDAQKYFSDGLSKYFEAKGITKQ